MYPPDSAKQYTVTALICTLNEAESLPHVLPKIPVWVDEILLLDGNSTDRTVEIARELCPNIKVVKQPGKGKGDALRKGIESAAGDIIVTLDADDATDPLEMPKFIDKLLLGYDYVKGTRFIQGKVYNKPWYRIVGNWFLTLTFDVLFLRFYSDLCSGYNAFWKDKFKNLQLFTHDGYENEPLINARIAKLRLKVTEVGHCDYGRSKGEIKESSWRQGIKAVRSLIRERFSD